LNPVRSHLNPVHIPPWNLKVYYLFKKTPLSVAIESYPDPNILFNKVHLNITTYLLINFQVSKSVSFIVFYIYIYIYPSMLPSFLSALQLGVSFGLLNNLPPFFSPSEADYVVSEQFSFYSVRLLASRPTPNLEDQGIPLRLAPIP
jgi:hypothetical protein